MKVLVLGGNGFIGSHVVDLLLLEGYEVRVFDNSPDCFRPQLSQVDYILGNFSDVSLLSSALSDVEVIFHFISSTVPSSSILNPVADIKDNLLSTVQLLELMRKNNVHKILYLSSGGTVYGNPESSPVPEGAALNPISSYGINKVAIEKYLYMYHCLYGLQYTILRPSNVFGSRQRNTGHQGLISTILSNMLVDKPLEVWGDGGVIRDYLHVSDLARLCVNILNVSDVHGIFNVGSGEGYSINDVIRLSQNVAEKKIKVKYCSKRSFDVLEIVLGINRVREQLGWSPKISLEGGVKEHLCWLRSLNA